MSYSYVWVFFVVVVSLFWLQSQNRNQMLNDYRIGCTNGNSVFEQSLHPAVSLWLFLAHGSARAANVGRGYAPVAKIHLSMWHGYLCGTYGIVLMSLMNGKRKFCHHTALTAFGEWWSAEECDAGHKQIHRMQMECRFATMFAQLVSRLKPNGASDKCKILCNKYRIRVIGCRSLSTK